MSVDKLTYNSITEVPYKDVRETEFLILGLREDGIMHIYMKPNATLTLDGAREAVKLVGEIGGGKAFPNLIDPQVNSSIDKAARKYSNSSEANIYTIADAILVKNIAHRLIANAYMNFNAPGKPTRMFTSKKRALEWLKGFS